MSGKKKGLIFCEQRAKGLTQSGVLARRCKICRCSRRTGRRNKPEVKQLERGNVVSGAKLGAEPGSANEAVGSAELCYRIGISAQL